MTLLVDPPSPRDRGGQRQSTQRSATDQLDGSQGGRGHADGAQTDVDDARLDGADVRGAEVDSAQLDIGQADSATAPKLAEPPIPGGRVEAVMGAIIRVLSHSPLARPLPAVVLSALGLGGVAFVGLCATAPVARAATPPVLLPLTSVARDLGAPHLPDAIADTLMYISIGLCCLGLAMMLWANSRGWSPNPRRVFAVAAGAVAVLVNITPVGSSDAASYAAYGRIAALGKNPYTFLPSNLPGGARHNPYTMLVSPYWQKTPSDYGPVATWAQQFAAEIGGAKPWLTIWVLMIMMGVAFVATGYVLLRTAANPVRAVLLWVANPLLIVELVMGGHLDALGALFAIAAIVLSHLEPEQSAGVLPLLTEEMRTEVLMRIASLNEVPQSALTELDQLVEKQANVAPPSPLRRIGGARTVAGILNAMERDKSGEELGKIEKADSEMHQQIKDLLFIFENLMDVDDRGIQALLREVGSDTLAIALRGAEPEVQEKILKNMSKRAAEILKDDMEARGPVKLADVEAAQKEIVTIAQRLADEGTISLGGKGGGEFV